MSSITATAHPQYSSPELNLLLAERAVAIQALVKRTRESIVEIGRLLTEVRNQVDRGRWLSWIETEFGWSDQTAYRFIHVFELSRDAKLHTVWGLDLPLRVLYQLAAPKAEAAREEIKEHIEAGEPITKEMVVAAVTGRRKSPAPAEPDPANSADPDPADHVEFDAAASAEASKAAYAASGVVDHEHDLDGADGADVAAVQHGEDDQPELAGDDQPKLAGDDQPEPAGDDQPEPAGDPPSKLSAEVWCAATNPADEAVKIEIMQGEELESILARMSETQKDKLFDRLVALQIRQAKLASKSADDMLKSLTGTFWYAAGQDDPQKIAEAVTVINGKLKMRGLSAKDIKFAVVNRERTISPTVAAAAQAARENLKRKKR